MITGRQACGVFSGEEGGLGWGCVICPAETCPELVQSKEGENRSQSKENVLEGERRARVSQHYRRLLCVLVSQTGIVMKPRIITHGSLGQGRGKLPREHYDLKALCLGYY